MFKYEPLHDAFIAPKWLVYGDQVVDVYKALLDSSNIYIYDFVDKYYIKSFGFNGHFIHDLQLYGYDDAEQAFWTYAYIDNMVKQKLISKLCRSRKNIYICQNEFPVFALYSLMAYPY